MSRTASSAAQKADRLKPKTLGTKSVFGGAVLSQVSLPQRSVGRELAHHPV
jgi:hypothetical protein